MSTTVTLTAHPNGTAGAPGPYVDILVDSIDAGVSFVTVWRTVKGRAMKVRGLVNVSSGSAVTILDSEAPDSVAASYQVQQFNSSGVFVSYSAAATVTLVFPPSSIISGMKAAWLHNPLDPSTGVEVAMLGTAAADISRPIDAEILRVIGRSVGVAITGGRHGIENVVLDCYTASLAEAARFDALFGGYDDDTVPVLCVRTPPAMALPPTLFALIAQPHQLPLNNQIGREGTRWGLTGTEVAPPPEALIVALLEYADFSAFYASYAAYTSAYLDYTAATRDYSIAGTA